MTGIQWTDRTWNPVVGCTPVSPGCLNCYAAKDAIRLEAMGVKQYQPRRIAADGSERIGHVAELLPAGTRTVRIAEKRAGRAVFTGDVRLVPEKLTEPLKWRKPAMCFLGSMADVFHESVSFAYIDRIFAVMSLCPDTTFQLPTKRPERMAEYLNQRCMTRPDGPIWKAVQAMNDLLPYGVNTSNWNSTAGGPSVPRWPLPNLWLLTSVENQAAADERILHLLNCPAVVRGLSVEPLLEDVNLGKNIGGTRWMGGQRGHHGRHQGKGTPDFPKDWHHHCDDRCQPGLDWVIVGGESGNKARPCNVEWIRSVVRQCKMADVPVFVKQLGTHVVCDNTKIADWEDQTNGKAYTRFDPDAQRFQGEIERVYVGDAKGGDMAEWPEDLRVREWPKACVAPSGLDG